MFSFTHSHPIEEKQLAVDANFYDIPNYFSSISQLALANNLAMGPGFATEIYELFLEFYHKSSHATPEGIIVVLSSIAHLSEKGYLQNIDYVTKQLNQLIKQIIEKKDQLKAPEIADLIWTLSIYVKNKKLSEIRPDQIFVLFLESYEKCGDDAECIGKILSSMSRLIEHNKIQSDSYISSLLDLFIRLSNHPNPSSYAITCGLWSIKQLVLYKNIQIPVEQTKKLISQLSQLQYSATTQEIADSLWAIAILVSTEAISLSQNELIEIMGFQDALKHHENSVYKENGLSALEHLRKPQEKESIFTIHSQEQKVAEIKQFNVEDVLDEMVITGKLLVPSNQTPATVIRALLKWLTDPNIKNWEYKTKIATLITQLLSSRPSIERLRLSMNDCAEALESIIILLVHYFHNYNHPGIDLKTFHTTLTNVLLDGNAYHLRMILWSMAKLSEGNKINKIDHGFVIQLIQRIHTQNKKEQPDIENLVLIVWSISKLVTEFFNLEALTATCINQINDLMDACAIQSKNISSFNQATKIMLALKNLSDKRVLDNNKITLVDNLFGCMYKFLDEARSIDIASNFYQLALLIESGKKPLIQLKSSELQALIKKFLQAEKTQLHESSNLLWSISILIENGYLTDINSSDVTQLLEKLFAHSKLNVNCAVKTLSSISRLVLSEFPITIDHIKIENLIKILIENNEYNKMPVKQAIEILLTTGMLTESETTKNFFRIYFPSEMKEEQKQSMFDSVNSSHRLIPTDPESPAKDLLSLTKLLETGELTPDQFDPIRFKDIFSRFHFQVKANNNSPTPLIVDVIFAFARALKYGLAIEFDKAGEDIDKFEFLIHVIASRKNATHHEILRIKESIEILVREQKLKHTSESVQHFVNKYRNAEVLIEEKESEDKLDSIVLQTDRLPKAIIDTGKTIKRLTGGKNVFLGGTGAADAAITEKEHTSDYDLRLFDLTEEDIENLYQHFNKIAKPGTCKKISGKHPQLQFEFEDNGKSYFIQLATSWKKKPGETDEEAMFRKANTGGINLECLYIPLTADSHSLELKGSRHDISTFKNKEISLIDVNYFANDPLRALRILKKEMDYNKFHFETSTELKTILRDKRFKSRMYDYLMLHDDKENNQIRFAKKLQSLSSEYGLYNLVFKMNNIGIINAIINTSDLAFSDLKETLTCLRDYDQKPFTAVDQQLNLSYFLLAHFCAKIKYMHPDFSPEQQLELLNKWQLKEFIWRFPNSEFPAYQDHIVRKWLDIPTKCQQDVSEPHFLAMLSRVDEYYEKCARKSNIPTYKGNNNPLFARNTHYQIGREQMRPRHHGAGFTRACS